MEDTNILVVILVPLGSLLLLLILRPIVLWYYKINEIVYLLEDIKYALTPQSKSKPTWVCPKCKFVNSNDVYDCKGCGFSLV